MGFGSRAGDGMNESTAHSGRQAGASQALALILALTLPLTPLMALVSNLPQLFQHFADVPHHEFLVPMILTIPSVCIAALAPVAGTLIDKWGRRRLMLFATLLFTVCGLMPLRLDSLYAILATQLGVGVAEAIIMTAGNTLLGDYFSPEARKRWLGVQAVLGAILATSIVLAGGALGTISWRAPFLLDALGAIVFVWFLVDTWEPDRGPAHSNGGADAQGRFPWSAMQKIFLVSILISVLYFVQAVELGLIFSKLGAVSSSTISWMTTIASVGIMLGGWFYRRQKQAAVARNLTLILAAFAIGLTGMGLSHSYVAALPFGVIAQFGNGLTVPVLVGWSLQTLDFKFRGRGMGLWTTCFFCGQFLSPTMMTLITRARGGDFLQAIVCIGLVCGGLALVAGLIARRQSPTALQGA